MRSRAGAPPPDLPDVTQQPRDAVEDALRQAVGGVGAQASGAAVPISRARKRWVPWAVAGASALVAAAAVLLLWLRGPERVMIEHEPVAEHTKSRPADALIGPIARERAGDASTRIDAIYADRLEGYRERRLARGRKP